jgi:hypothetical protein
VADARTIKGQYPEAYNIQIYINMRLPRCLYFKFCFNLSHALSHLVGHLEWRLMMAYVDAFQKPNKICIFVDQCSVSIIDVVKPIHTSIFEILAIPFQPSVTLVDSLQTPRARQLTGFSHTRIEADHNDFLRSRFPF